MRGRHTLGILLLCACKSELGGDNVNNEVDDAETNSDTQTVQDDAAPDGMTALGPWGTPALVPGANTTAQEDDAALSSDTLELYFKKVDATDANLYVMTRASTSSPWSTPAPVTTLNTSGASPANDEESPRLSANDLTMYFGRGGDIYKSTRASKTSPWGTATAVTILNPTAPAANYEKWADVCDTGYAIVSRNGGGNGQDLVEGTITAGAATVLTDLNSPQADQGTLLMPDCKTLYFQSNRDGEFNIYMATRATATGAWGSPIKLPDFNTTQFGEEDPWTSPDGHTFVFVSNASGNKDVYISTR
jgi:Tol biopolymer transport system component